MIGTSSLKMIILTCPCLTLAAQAFSDAEIPYYDVSIIVTGAAETVWSILAVMSQRRKKILAWKSLARINTSFKKCNFTKKFARIFQWAILQFLPKRLIVSPPLTDRWIRPWTLVTVQVRSHRGRVFTTNFHWQIDCTGSISCQFSG